MGDNEEILSFSELIGNKSEKEIIESVDKDDSVMSFVEFLESDNKVGEQVKEIVSETEKELEQIEPNLDQSRTDKVIEALKKTRITNRVNLMDPEYLKDAHAKYLELINSEDYKKKLELGKKHVSNVSGGLKRTIGQVIVAFSSRIGTAIIGKSKIA